MESRNEADRAVDRTNGQDFYGRKLHVELSKKPFMENK